MIVPFATPPARLVTAFGTVPYVDTVSGELRHGPIESSPANLTFALDSNSASLSCYGYLFHDSGHTREPIVCLADRCYSLSADTSARDPATPTVLELILLERGLIAFKAGDFFLSAIPDGRILLRAAECSTWELFLASQDWCSNAVAAVAERSWRDAGAVFDRKKIESYIVHPIVRTRANTRPKAIKVLIYGYSRWSHGRVYYDLCKHLHARGYIVDILDWQVDHTGYIRDIITYYDLFMTALDGVPRLIDAYDVPVDRIIAVSHHELEIRMLIEQKGIEIFDKFASYGAVSEFIYCASLMRGVPRVPMVASLGINFSEFHAEVSERLETVGYASSMSVQTLGIEWKRGELAEAAAREAGLAFKIAGWTGDQTSFHDMPDFYRSVDAVLTSSISEAAQLPVMEGAAAGRLVIGTPVGHFPRKAYEGAGILAPIEADKFKSFTAATLLYYKADPAAYVDKCRSIQEAARKFDWQYSIGEWIELIESAKSAASRARMTIRKPRVGVITDINWLSSYIILEHYYLVKLLQDQYGFEIIDTLTIDADNPDTIRHLNSYDVLLIAYQKLVKPPLHLVSAYKIFRIDDLVSYNPAYDTLLDYLITNSDMIISPYAYEFSNHYKHDNVVWVPYSSALEGCKNHEEITFNCDPVEKVLVAGSVASDRPFRTYAVGLEGEQIEVLAHPGYGGHFDDNSKAPVRANYFRALNKYLCCFTDAHTFRYIHLKNFEIASVGSLLLTDKAIEKEMNALGFVDYETCIFADQGNFLEKVSWILDKENRERVDQIRWAGMELVRSKHMTRHRALQVKEIVDNVCRDGQLTRTGRTEAAGRVATL